MAEFIDSGGGGGVELIWSGTADSAPHLPFESGMYAVRITLPVEIPEWVQPWLTEQLMRALSAAGLRNVAVAAGGTQIVIGFEV